MEKFGGKKLLVLHVKGFLIDCFHGNSSDKRPNRRPDARVNNNYVYRRPGCEQFVKFCLDNFVVGVWSSAYAHNVFPLVDFTFGNDAKRLAFIWHKEHGTDSKRKHPDNPYKPLIWKELSKLWNKELSSLPWTRKGDFGPWNTVLIDDDPYAIQRNPPNTAIILETYRGTAPDDKHLEKLRKYLEGLAEAEDVQRYLQEKPFNSSSLCNDDLPLELLNSLALKEPTEISGAAPKSRGKISEKKIPQLLSEPVDSTEARRTKNEEEQDLDDSKSSKDGVGNTPSKTPSVEGEEPQISKNDLDNDESDHRRRVGGIKNTLSLVPRSKELQPSNTLSTKDKTTEASALLRGE